MIRYKCTDMCIHGLIYKLNKFDIKLQGEYVFDLKDNE